jgi:hypothetical protein
MVLHFGFSIQKNASIGTLSIVLATTVSRTPSLFIQRHRQRQLLRRSRGNCFYFEYWRIDGHAVAGQPLAAVTGEKPLKKIIGDTGKDDEAAN